jgi:H+/gluconate symporter-like permease
MDIVGIPLGLGLLILLAFRGWSVLLLAPAAALLAAVSAGEPVLAHWTQTFMGAAARFVAQFFPIFLLGALFGKLMDESGSIRTIAGFLGDRLGKKHVVLAVVLVGAIVTYGGVSLMVSFFVIGPMAMTLFREADLPRRLMPAAIGLGTFTFTMTAMPGAPAVQNAIPIPYFGTTPFAAPGLGLIASAVILCFGLWWIGRSISAAKLAGEGFGRPGERELEDVAGDVRVREVATAGRDFDPAELRDRHVAETGPPLLLAIAPLIVVLSVNALMSLVVLPGFDASFLSETRWGSTSLARVGGVWAVVTALAAAIIAVLIINWRRLHDIRAAVDAGANASVLPTLSVASLVGFGAVVAALPAFAAIRDFMLTLEGGPLVSLAASVNVLAAMTGSASGGLSIALNALGENYLRLAVEQGISPALLHRVAVIGAGTLDALPHNGAVITLLAVCGTTHRESYLPLAITLIGGPILGLGTVILLGSIFGAF